MQSASIMRSSSLIAWTVWKALFLREAVARLSAGRAAWLWLLLEPVVHLVFIIVLFGFVLQRVVSGIDYSLFIATGILGFILARNTATRSKEAINANDTLFTYRQVFPVDTVLVRAALEGSPLFDQCLVSYRGTWPIWVRGVSSRLFASSVGLRSPMDGRYRPGAYIFRCVSVDSRIRESEWNAVWSLCISCPGSCTRLRRSLPRIKAGSC